MALLAEKAEWCVILPKMALLAFLGYLPMKMAKTPKMALFRVSRAFALEARNFSHFGLKIGHFRQLGENTLFKGKFTLFRDFSLLGYKLPLTGIPLI